MKKVLFSLLISISFYTSQAQKIAIIGSKSLETTEDGVSILALENLTAGEVYYFTENEYDNGLNAFVDAAESVVKITITTTITKGNVIYFKENTPSSSNTFTATVTAGSGSVTVVHVASSGSFSIGSLGEILYLYSDNDTDPTNGVSEIHSAFYPGSGNNDNTGGAIPASENPSSDFPNAIIVHNFPEYSFGVDPYFSYGVNRVEYKVSTADRTDVNRVKLENPTNYVFAGNNQDLSTTKFTNFNLVTANPVITLTTSVSQLNENSSSNFNFTFTADVASTSNLVINFSVNGSSANGIALFGSDYTQTGATSMNITSGTVTIASGTTSKTVVLNPTGDTTLEPDEKIKLSIITGTGYDFGSPSEQTVTITNDDTKTIVPEVAITGLRHYVGTENDVSEFSFVALKDILAGVEYVFSSNPFDKSTLLFSDVSTYPSELKWTAPSGGVARGDVIVVKKTALNTFTITRNGSTLTTGTVTKLSPSKNFYISQYGGFFRAHTDTDDNPYNGIIAIHSQVFTYEVTNGFGGVMPTSLDLSTLYVGSVLVDDFSNASPGRLEYNPTLRPATTIDQANFENPTNWLYGQAMQDLSPTSFNNIIISEGSANPKATVAVSSSSIMEDTEVATYTFSLDAAAISDITINFLVAGSAFFSTDYAIAGASSYTETTGSIVIADGTSSSQLTLTPVTDTNLETTENVQLTITTGIGYDGGSPGSTAVNIINDDTSDSEVKLAIIGINHESPSSISLVAMNNILANSTFYFLRNQFNKETLSFQSGGKYKLVTPNTCIPKGTVLTITGDVSGPLTVNCNGTSGSECGTATIVGSGNSFDFLDIGTRYYTFQDSDEDHTNGISQIHSVFHTGGTYPSNHTGGTLTPEENPKSVYSNAIVVDGFPNLAPNRTEFDASKRVVDVSTTLIENTENYVYAQPNTLLSTTNFNIIPTPITYVNIAATAGGDGTSWATAYNSLQDALANSLACNNEIWVAKGTYKPHTSDQNISFSISANTKIYGGFNGTEALVTERDWNTNPTILSGDLNNSNTSNAGDSHTIMLIQNNDVVIDGVIFEYGYADGDGEAFGVDGGAIYSISNLSLQNCVFRNNYAKNVGGAMLATGDLVRLENTLFYGNTGIERAGGVYMNNTYGNIRVINSTFYNNSSLQGGALEVRRGTSVIGNSIFAGNSGPPENISFSLTGTGTLYNSILDGSIPSRLTNGGNNLFNTNPLFNNATNNDFSLTANSSAINSGDSSLITTTKDLNGNSRKIGTVDMGAFEFQDIVSRWIGTSSNDWNTISNWNNDVPDDAIFAVIPSGIPNAPIITSSNNIIKHITINPGASLEINATGSLTVNGNLTNTGTLIANSGSSIIISGKSSGDIIYKRNLSTTNWYLVSSPVVGETIENYRTNNSLATGSGTNVGLAPYLNDGSAWDYQTTSSTGIMNSGVGYSTKLSTPGNVSFTGTMPITNIAIPLTNGTENEFNLLGNPYPSYIPVNVGADATNNILTVNSPQINEETIWFWDESLDEYITINQVSNRFIAPGQGFFVSAKVGGGTFAFTEAMQSHQTADVFSKITNNRFEINLSINDGKNTKSTDVYYIKGTTTGFDNGYDSSIFSGTGNNFVVYTHLVADGDEVMDLAIQSLPDSNYESMVIPVGIKDLAETEITFSVAALNLPDGINVYLEDRETNTFTQLDKANSSYTVDLTKNYSGIGRFYLHTNTSSALNVESVLLENVSIYKTTNSSLRITGLQTGTTSVKLFDIQGKQVLQQSFNTDGLKDILLPKVSAGIYLVQLQTENGKVSKKIVIN